MTINSMEAFDDPDYLAGQVILLKVNVIACVEGMDDVAFWKDVFKKFATWLKIEFHPHSREKESGGKSVVLTEANIKNADKHFILCIDSDFDHLLKAEPINSNPYIFQTYAYSIENYKIAPENLSDIVEKAALYEKGVDFVSFFEKFSQAVYKLFLYLLYFEKIKRDKHKNGEKADSEKLVEEKKLKDIMCVSSAETDSSDIKKSISDFLDSLKEKVNAFEKDIKAKYGSIDLKQIEELIRDFHIKSSELCWYIKGHILYDCIVTVLLNKLIPCYRKEKNKSYTTRQKKNEYGNKFEKIDHKTLLRQNHIRCLAFENCPPMNKIKEDIINYCKELRS